MALVAPIALWDDAWRKSRLGRFEMHERFNAICLDQSQDSTEGALVRPPEVDRLFLPVISAKSDDLRFLAILNARLFQVARFAHRRALTPVPSR